jgi:putative transposase
MNKIDTHRLYLNKNSVTFINQGIGSSRFMYNQMLNKSKEAYELYLSNPNLYTKPGLTLESLSLMIKEIRNNPEYPWLLNTPAGCFLSVCNNLAFAYKKFFDNLRKGKKAGYPRFKRFSYEGSVTFQKHQYKIVEVDGRNYLRLEGLWLDKKLKIPNLIRINNSKPIPENTKSITIKRNSCGQYFVSFLYEQDLIWVPTSKALSIDFGLKDSIVAYDGENIYKVPNPKILKQKEARLKRYQRRLSKKKKGSCNYHKARIKVARHHQQIKNIREHHIKYTISQLVKDVHTVIIEDLSIKSMVKNHKLSKSIHDASWHKFKMAIMNKCLTNGLSLCQANRFFPSTQLCNSCGNRNDLKVKLGISEWICQHCGTIHDRDANAAMNLYDLLNVKGSYLEIKDINLTKLIIKEGVHIKETPIKKDNKKTSKEKLISVY